MGAFLSTLAEAVKQYLLPGSMFLLLLIITIGLAFWYLREDKRRWVRGCLTGVVAAYWLLATPAISGLIKSALVGSYRPLTEAGSIQAVVVLGGGAESYRQAGRRLTNLSDASAFRVLEAARLYRQFDPVWVIASGGPGHDPRTPESEPLKAALVSLNVPAEVILTESRSGDTHEQAVLLAPLLAAHGIQRFALVTSPTHMRRAMLAFEQVGLDPIASVAPDHSDSDGSERRPPALLPNLDALQQSVVACREVLGLTYYWLRGWI